MKIALLAPSGVPFVVGGAEKLWWGLAQHINQHTVHEMELIKLPSPERSFWEIVRSYEQFSRLDVMHFDAVISTKYPAWMVQHPNHVVYLQHKLRGLYDTWPSGLATDLPLVPQGLQPLWRLLQRRQVDRGQLDELFGELQRLREGHLGEPWLEDLTGLPGPLIRAVVHKLDGIALAPGQIRSYWAISQVVAERAGYFPPGVDVGVLPHPSNLQGLHTGPGRCVFTASRHDGPKRLDWLVRAYRESRSALPFVVAGEGPQTPLLKELAAGDERIRFAGRLTDEEMVAHYAAAVLVPFVPEQEDMGLITLEAMACGKPVLTTTDAGGVTEFVQDGVNGRVVAPTVGALRQAFDELLTEPQVCQAMEAAALATAATVSWARTANTLMTACAEGARVVAPTLRNTLATSAGSGTGVATGPERKRLLVVNTFAVYPPDSGGKKRVYYLYQALAQHWDVTLLNLLPEGETPECLTFGPHYREVRVPASRAFGQQEQALTRQLHHPVTDIAALKFGDLLHDWRQAFVQLSAATDVVVCAHCYLAPTVEALWQGPVWYDAHNVEADMKADVLGVPRLEAAVVDGNGRGEVALTCLREVAAVEARLLARAERLLVTGSDDATRFSELYPDTFDRTRVCLAPNGTTVPESLALDAGARHLLKQRLGWDGPVALFLGSYHGPNLSALQHVLKAASLLPDWRFVVVGSVCHAIKNHTLPANVWPLGLRTEAELTVLLKAVDVGLNPMEAGSGTNLKMLDYAAHGALVVSSATGARGLGFAAGESYLECAAHHMAPTLSELTTWSAPQWQAMREAAYRHVALGFGWPQIALGVVRWH